MKRFPAPHCPSLASASVMVFGLVLTTASLAANGEMATADKENPRETLVVTASRVAQPLDSLAGSISVVSEEEILQVAHIHASELLSRIPGVWVSRGNGQEHLTAIRSPVLTGAGSCGAFYIAEDGIPVRATGFCNVNELFDVNTEQAQRIEVIRGPGTALHGSNALHGVINVLSEAPAADAGTRLSLEGGPHDYGRIKLSIGDTTQRHGYRININGASDRGYKDDSGFDQQKMTLRYDYHGDQWNSATLVSASNLNQETAGYIDGEDAYKDESNLKRNDNPEAYRDTRSLRWQTRFEHKTARDGVFVFTPYARHTEMDFLMHFLPEDPLEQNGQTSIGLQSTYRRAVNDQLVLVQGFDTEFTEAWLEQEQTLPTNGSFPQGKQYDYDVSAQLLAAFIAGEYQWTDRLSALFGTRLESLTYDYDNRMLSGNTDESGNICVNAFSGKIGCRYTRPDDREDDFENLSANAGLIFRQSDALITTLRLTHGFRAPQATEMYRLQEGQMEANLDSEELNSFELGFKGSQGAFSYSVTGFFMKKNDVIFQSSDRLNLSEGKTRHVGLEYELFWQLGQYWDIGAAGTFARHKYANDVTAPGSNTAISTKGNDIDTAPRRMSSVRIGWQPLDSTRLELEWMAMGAYYTDIENEHRYDGHNLLHLRLRHEFSKTLTAGIRVTNLADKLYADRADYSAFGGDRYFIGEPRSIYGDIQLRF